MSLETKKKVVKTSSPQEEKISLDELIELKKILKGLEIQNKMGKLAQTNRISLVKRKIARLLTKKNEK